MPEGTNLELVEASIIDSTYPEFGRLATDLYSRIKEKVETAAEPVDFGNTALDIGARDGRYTSVIRQLGPKAITAIDPNVQELQKGIDRSFIRDKEVFRGTLEEYTKQATSQADSTFVFNVSPSLADNPQFIDALLQVVKPGGIVVVSFAEKETAIRLVSRTFWNGKLESIKEKPSLKKKEISRVDDREGGVNYFLSIGRRTTK